MTELPIFCLRFAKHKLFRTFLKKIYNQAAFLVRGFTCGFNWVSVNFQTTSGSSEKRYLSLKNNTRKNDLRELVIRKGKGNKGWFSGSFQCEESQAIELNFNFLTPKRKYKAKKYSEGGLMYNPTCFPSQYNNEQYISLRYLAGLSQKFEKAIEC